MNIKYTPEQETELQSGYDACETHDEREDYILKFMAKHGKSKRSIVAKLSKMGIYVARPTVSKVTGRAPETKKQLVRNLAITWGFDPDEMEGLDKAPKLVLDKLWRKFSEK